MVVDHIRAFRRRLQREAAERVVATPHGDGILSDSIPNVYDHNYLSVEDPAVGAAALAAEADSVLEDRMHRRVIAETGAAGLADEFLGLGYVRSTHLVLAHTRGPDRVVDTSAVREVPHDELAAPRREAVLREPWGDEAIAAQLDLAKRQIAAAVPTRYFAVLADGEPAGWCELRTRDGVAQIEDVEVLERFRGRGLGRVVVQAALDEGRRTAGVVFLEALADDWPRELYAKLGFTVVDTRDFYTRLPHPLSRVVMRTPRLELRLATVAELRRLYRIAEQGIHDPAEMPFEVPWTDSLTEEAFLAHHRERQEFVAFLDGAPIGVQGLSLRLPEVSTGSWLGKAYQGQGLGTEMRTAVLTLAFEHLGAAVAHSGALGANEQSLGVSRKLGYRVTGMRTRAPRGTAVPHTDLELRREDFRPAVRVQVQAPENLARLLG